MYQYFSEKDFTEARPQCSLSDMDPDFLRLLDRARKIAGIPFIINSAYRSVAYEKAKGRTGTSSHCLGLAVDIRCRNGSERLKIVYSLIQVGFRRIGIGKSFIHVDCDETKSPSIWLY